MTFSDEGDDLVTKLRLRQLNLQIERCHWAVKMHLDLSTRREDYGRQAITQLSATFVRWPQRGKKTTYSFPTWWDHLKRDLKRRFPRLFGWLKFNETATMHEAMLVFPAIDLPSEMKEGMFAVWMKASSETEERL